MENDKYSSLIEAILFYENDVVSMEKLIKYTNIPEEKIRDVINELILQFENTNRGLTIVETPTGFILQIKKEILSEVRQIYNIKEKTKLSQSLLTVLSIIAYKQPITKTEIEDIRGVSSDNAVRTLLEKNLVQIVGRKEVLGRPLLYGTTEEFLKQFNLKDIKDLPQLNELKSEEFTIDEEN
ncbi:MAG: SMC-Scp complex subunit ScpB [Spirochaetes bacterium GWD1_27_9]|nr:MAG: SMC-Scp complex subunit ScpB [Spirochaetes bacterium GWB1_27_13]OHD22235.1 MAG: SMC-Scp complex subunit ScpB [Spirochaetes bacterium GWC1_27_15]OHD44787.1 MAG: SMC-Scp complex subunit ScpB [Spirochaetes bacterium GWD1_27_9]